MSRKRQINDGKQGNEIALFMLVPEKLKQQLKAEAALNGETLSAYTTKILIDRKQACNKQTR